MSIETSIYITAFAILGASLWISGRRRSGTVEEASRALELDGLVRPVFLFSTTAPVARC